MPPSFSQNLLQVRHLRKPLHCRIVAQRRYPITRRSFHAANRLQAASNPSESGHSVIDQSTPPDELEPGNESSKASRDGAENLKFYGSARRRAMRNGKPRFSAESLPISLPQSFLEDNVILASDNNGEVLVRPVPSSSTSESEPTPVILAEAPANTEQTSSDHPEKTEIYSGPATKYEVSEDIWKEFDLSVRAGLKQPRTESQDIAAGREKCHLIINSISESGQCLVQSSIKQLAGEHNADIVVLDALDIGRIAASHHHGNSDIKNLIDLGFEVYSESSDSANEIIPFVEEEEAPEPGEMEGDSNSSAESFSFPTNKPVSVSTAVHLNLSDAVRPLLEKLGLNRSGNNQSESIFLADLDDQTRTFREQKDSRIWSTFIHQIIRAPSAKGTNSQSTTSNENEPSKSLVILIHDISKIMQNKDGEKFINKLVKTVEEKRRNGQPILLVGSMSTKFEEYKQQLSDSNFEFDEDGVWQTLVIPPLMRDIHAKATFYEDRKRWYRNVNERQLNDALRQKKSSLMVNPLSEPVFTSSQPNDKHPAILAAKFKVNHRYLSSNQINRMATFIAGNDLTEPDVPFTASDVRTSLGLLWKSDAARAAWMHDQGKSDREKVPVLEPTHDDKMKQIQKSCSKHERRLLGGVVEADKIRTTFADVHAPIETVDALKTLTTLSLIRPDAFSYGVLATDKIPGLLLYGPPGTGKTLLAKAVAKESGARVLEVSGAEINDMYVGESEKNIKALFTLAKKLTPCVIFIDEADALFSSRTQSKQRTAHREMINQFLREWDGMSNDAGGAFIMVATNRPFDLDDAVLRRLPRRLLVDLPGEQDRLQILKIHLKDEVLAEDVNIPSLASKTQFYSGSDLKNLAVAAALNCVREENELATQHSGEEPYVHAPRRTLHQRHFERALEEITASISDEMDTLKSIKKFDEQFGDRRGKKKKKAPKWGFRTPAEADQVLDTIKVRE